MPTKQEGIDHGVSFDGSGFKTGECYCPKCPKKEIFEDKGTKTHKQCLGVVND